MNTLPQKTQWELVADAVAALGGKANRNEVWEYLKRTLPDIPFSTVSAELNAVAVNAPARTSYHAGSQARRTDAGNRYDRLFKVGAGSAAYYEVYDPAVHGIWEIYADPAATSTHRTAVRRLDDVSMQSLTVLLTAGAVDNTFFPVKALDSGFFPDAMIRSKNPDGPGMPARFTTDAGTTFDSDIYRGTNTGYLHNRAAASAYYGTKGVKGGDSLRYEKIADDEYRIVHLPSASTVAKGPDDATHISLGGPSVTTNRILFGPPGTGKTYHTVNEALELLDPEFRQAHEDDRAALKARFDELAAEHRIRFVTFHQSFSYEDFVEGIRADSEGGELQYRVEPGVFRRICEDAGGSAQVASDIGVREDARIWKISIDGTGPSSPTRDYCLANGEARIGWHAVGDLRNERLVDLPAYAALGSNDRSTLQAFSREIEPGDVLLCIRSENEVLAVGVVQGEYDHEPRPPAGVREDYHNVLPVRWLATDLALDIRPINDGRKFTLKTVYEMSRFGWTELAEYMEAEGVVLQGRAPSLRSRALPHVLIIDEINRGNVSRIFGELITLIEPSKRKGASEALEVVLPYSRKRFSVPHNVHIIGTMNTADRSLAGLDVALRRRFEFREMMPDTGALAGVAVAGISVDRMLETMNQRIEVLLGRDFMIGHAYFMGLEDSSGLEDLARIFRRQVLPLLQEYFFEDWEKIALVLNDHRKASEDRFVRERAAGLEALFGAEVDVPRGGSLWEVNNGALARVEAYRGIIAVASTPA